MIIMAIDPGSSNLGVSILDGDKLLYCNRFRAETQYDSFVDKLNDKLEKTFHELTALINRFAVTHVCWELVPGGARMNYKDFVVSISALVKTLAFQYELSWQGIAANTSKKTMTGDARATKIAVRDRVIELYPEIRKDFKLGTQTWDAYDSVIIGRACQVKGVWHKPKPSSFTGRNW